MAAVVHWCARARRVDFEDVRVLVEGHDVEKTGMSRNGQ